MSMVSSWGNPMVLTCFNLNYPCNQGWQGAMQFLGLHLAKHLFLLHSFESMPDRSAVHILAQNTSPFGSERRDEFCDVHMGLNIYIYTNTIDEACWQGNKIIMQHVKFQMGGDVAQLPPTTHGKLAHTAITGFFKAKTCGTHEKTHVSGWQNHGLPFIFKLFKCIWMTFNSDFAGFSMVFPWPQQVVTQVAAAASACLRARFRAWPGAAKIEEAHSCTSKILGILTHLHRTGGKHLSYHIFTPTHTWIYIYLYA